MRWIGPGTFWMGSPEDEPERHLDEGPRHLETIEEGFWLADTPCTQAVWAAVMEENPSYFQDPDRPVEQVDWRGCQEFCRRLGEQTREPGWRLPTEVEWEFACRAGTEEATYAGPVDVLDPSNVSILNPIAWYMANSGADYDHNVAENLPWWPEIQVELAKGGTRRVKTKMPNAWGLYDTLGNVWEWCQDLWSRNYSESAGGFEKVVRGGSWLSRAQYVRAAFRHAEDPWMRRFSLGFRFARD
jgi:formylglycine-generating enzyme required for sulfatase activity